MNRLRASVSSFGDNSESCCLPDTGKEDKGMQKAVPGVLCAANLKGSAK